MAEVLCKRAIANDDGSQAAVSIIFNKKHPFEFNVRLHVLPDGTDLSVWIADGEASGQTSFDSLQARAKVLANAIQFLPKFNGKDEPTLYIDAKAVDPPLTLTRGVKVQVYDDSCKVWRLGKVSRVRQNGTVNVQYTDATKGQSIPRQNVRIMGRFRPGQYNIISSKTSSSEGINTRSKESNRDPEGDWRETKEDHKNPRSHYASRDDDASVDLHQPPNRLESPDPRISADPSKLPRELNVPPLQFSSRGDSSKKRTDEADSNEQYPTSRGDEEFPTVDNSSRFAETKSPHSSIAQCPASVRSQDSMQKSPRSALNNGGKNDAGRVSENGDVDDSTDVPGKISHREPTGDPPRAVDREGSFDFRQIDDSLDDGNSRGPRIVKPLKSTAENSNEPAPNVSIRIPSDIDTNEESIDKDITERVGEIGKSGLVRVYTITYNAGWAWNLPKKLLKDLIPFGYDIYCIALQALNMDSRSVCGAIMAVMPHGFAELRTVSVNNMHTVVLAHAVLFPLLSDISSDYIPIGSDDDTNNNRDADIDSTVPELTTSAQNRESRLKGAQAVTFALLTKTFLFVNCFLEPSHSASGDLSRKFNYSEVNSRVRAPTGRYELSKPLAKRADYVWWMGGFNYRLNMNDYSSGWRLLQSGKLSELLRKFDGLHNSGMYTDYEEMQIRFPPTYPYTYTRRDSSPKIPVLDEEKLSGLGEEEPSIDTGKAKTNQDSDEATPREEDTRDEEVEGPANFSDAEFPAWCDRILVNQILSGEEGQESRSERRALDYMSSDGQHFSSHHAVYALFEVRISEPRSLFLTWAGKNAIFQEALEIGFEEINKHDIAEKKATQKAAQKAAQKNRKVAAIKDSTKSKVCAIQ